MECTQCGVSNREQANFCRNCGSLLLIACPRCESGLPEAANYCDNCGLSMTGGQFAAWWSPAGLEGASGPGPIVETPQDMRISGTPLRGPTDLSDQRAPSPRSRSGPRPTSSAAGPTPTTEEGNLQQYIPRELQAKLSAARDRGEMVGERRVVTMLFCDVKGSTASAEHMDPEEWGEVINGAFEFMIKPIYRYEGIVARMMGDGILAFFGAPIAHEDDPQRAVLAGLDIVDGIEPYRDKIAQSFGVDIDVRVGINTGLVVVGAVGSNLRMEYTALGDAINLAARMEQTAEPGSVQISENTYKLIQSLFEVEALGEIEVKGKSEPVQAYRVLGRSGEAHRVRGIEGFQAELVGRKGELATLREVMDNLQQGVGRIVCVLGEAGMGKSRLVSEARTIYQDLTQGDGNWYETSTLSYETNQAYGLFQRLIRRVTGISHDDPPALAQENLQALIETLPEPRRPRATQVLSALLGLPVDDLDFPVEGETFRRHLFEAIQDWWLSWFSDKPTVLVFDDMHWSDAASIELMLKLLPLTGEIPLVMLTAMRAERSAPAWQIKAAADETYHHRYTEMILPPLTDQESNEMVNRLLEDPELPDQMRASILEKAAGNPFFIEEVVRSLIEGGAIVPEEVSVDGERQQQWRASSQAAEVAIPDNLRSLLAARLDRLEETTRATLQVASVIGRNFYHRVLEAVDDVDADLDKNVSALLRMEMIKESARVPEIEYSFRNPLTQEAVYKTILLKRRREFHRRVGEAMEALYPDRIEGQYGLLAHHFTLAGERDKAIEYSRLASRQAVSLFAFDDAVQNLRTALRLIDPSEKSEIHHLLLEELGDVYCLLRDGSQALEMYATAFDLWQELDSPDRLVEVRLHRKVVQTVTDLKWSVSLENLRQADDARVKAVASLQDALAAMDPVEPHAEIVRALCALSVDAWRIQEPPDWDLAQEYAESAVEMAKVLDSPVDLSQALGALESVLDGRSKLREHLDVAKQRLEICRDPEFTDQRECLDALRGLGAAHMYVGEYKEALPLLQEAEEMAARLQAIDQTANALGLQAQCMYRGDQWDAVIALESKWRELEAQYTRERVGET